MERRQTACRQVGSGNARHGSSADQCSEHSTSHWQIAVATISLGDLFVEDVSPAPDCGHLLVHVVVAPDRTVGDALGALRRDTPRLRSDVAMAITRKRAPELSFVPAFLDGGNNE
jgi:ribosome-binding factor A